MDVLKDVTEYFEEQLGESILARNQALRTAFASTKSGNSALTKSIVIETLKDLGPPDLCHLTKIHKQLEKAGPNTNAPSAEVAFLGRSGIVWRYHLAMF